MRYGNRAFHAWVKVATDSDSHTLINDIEEQVVLFTESFCNGDKVVVKPLKRNGGSHIALGIHFPNIPPQVVHVCMPVATLSGRGEEGAFCVYLLHWQSEGL